MVIAHKETEAAVIDRYEWCRSMGHRIHLNMAECRLQRQATLELCLF